MLGSIKVDRPRLTNSKIIFKQFQPMWSQYLNVMDRNITCRSITMLCVASRGNATARCALFVQQIIHTEDVQVLSIPFPSVLLALSD